MSDVVETLGKLTGVDDCRELGRFDVAAYDLCWEDSVWARGCGGSWSAFAIERSHYGMVARHRLTLKRT